MTHQNSAAKIEAIGHSVMRKVEIMGHWQVSLATTIATVLIVIGARYYYSFVTGYIVPDEAWYYNTFILDRAPITSYREVFVAIFLLFFYGVNDVWTFLLRGALYSAIWALGCVVLFFMILRMLRVSENMLSLLLLSLPLFPVFIILVPTVLTETLGLFMALFGVYFGLRHIQEGRVVNSLLSGVFFVLAYKVREPYLMFAAGNVLLFLAVSAKRRSLGSILGYAIPVSLVFPVPVSLQPLQFAQPVYNWIANLISHLLSWGSQPGSSASSATSQAPTLTPAFAVPITATLQVDLTRAVIEGLSYGFNPLFAAFAMLSVIAVGVDFFRSRILNAFFLALNAAWSFGAFIVATAIFLQVMPGALVTWTSAIIRTSHAALPSIAGFPNLYRHLRVKRIAALTIILLILGSTQIGLVANGFQRGLSVEPIDRLSLDYRAPYYRAYLLARDSGKTLVFGGIHMRGIRMYMVMLPNVVLVPVGLRWQPALNEGQFQAWLKGGWDTILLYDDWFTIKVPSMIDDYPEFYSQILRSRQYPGYVVETLWIDGESYALRMVKMSNASPGLLP